MMWKGKWKNQSWLSRDWHRENRQIYFLTWYYEFVSLPNLSSFFFHYSLKIQVIYGQSEFWKKKWLSDKIQIVHTDLSQGKFLPRMQSTHKVLLCSCITQLELINGRSTSLKYISRFASRDPLNFYSLFLHLQFLHLSGLDPSLDLCPILCI